MEKDSGQPLKSELSCSEGGRPQLGTAGMRSWGPSFRPHGTEILVSLPNVLFLKQTQLKGQKDLILLFPSVSWDGKRGCAKTELWSNRFGKHWNNQR